MLRKQCVSAVMFSYVSEYICVKSCDITLPCQSTLKSILLLVNKYMCTLSKGGLET